jgi:hypothetical protein
MVLIYGDVVSINGDAVLIYGSIIFITMMSTIYRWPGRYPDQFDDGKTDTVKIVVILSSFTKNIEIPYFFPSIPAQKHSIY